MADLMTATYATSYPYSHHDSPVRRDVLPPYSALRSKRRSPPPRVLIALYRTSAEFGVTTLENMFLTADDATFPLKRTFSIDEAVERSHVVKIWPVPKLCC
jgi:hypothetical protein